MRAVAAAGESRRRTILAVVTSQNDRGPVTADNRQRHLLGRSSQLDELTSAFEAVAGGVPPVAAEAEGDGAKSGRRSKTAARG